MGHLGCQRSISKHVGASKARFGADGASWLQGSILMHFGEAPESDLELLGHLGRQGGIFET